MSIQLPKDPRSITMREFSYELPAERIARYPLKDRDASKLLVYENGTISDRTFSELPSLLLPGDRIVFNETKVIHARLLFTKGTGAVIELLCLEPLDHPDPAVALQQKNECTWSVMIGNLKRWKDGCLELTIRMTEGESILKAEKLSAEHVKFTWSGDYPFSEIIEQAGKLPIPPYLDRDAEASDETAYQTVYARNEGSVAAPTAGLHFTQNVLDALADRGIERTNLTLHVGAGTFRPVKSESVGGHSMHEERIVVEKGALAQLRDFLQHREKSTESTPPRLVAVGTTSLRTLESLYWLGVSRSSGNPSLQLPQWFAYDYEGGDVTPSRALTALLLSLENAGSDRLVAATSLLIAPGYRFRMADVLVTNFHQPDSTLLLLIAAFVGQNWRNVYHHALDNGYRFLSYGDSSLLFRKDQ
jgi:S-adenosylmethionine:tRNA ribosyltransferase-isomerase